jgi:hypothetical protein
MASTTTKGDVAVLCAAIIICAAFIAMSFYQYGYDDAAAAAKCKPPGMKMDINKMTLKSQARWITFWKSQGAYK